jgi:hypothetical protein
MVFFVAVGTVGILFGAPGLWAQVSTAGHAHGEVWALSRHA